MSTSLQTYIMTNFHDLYHFKSTFSAAALGMVNSGWVWLVTDEVGNMEVVATFGSGTLLVRSRTHMQSGILPIIGESIHSQYDGAGAPRPHRDMRRRALTYSTTVSQGRTVPPNIYNSTAPTVSEQAEASRQNLPQSGNAFEGIGDFLTPLLCISVQEHAWVGTGYGVWGKEEYLKRFWSVVNWRNISETFSRIVKSRR